MPLNPIDPEPYTHKYIMVWCRAAHEWAAEATAILGFMVWVLTLNPTSEPYRP